MKTHLLLIILIVSGQTNESDLELLAEDLDILARVTNAIALQTGAFDHSIQLKDVVAELIQVKITDFNTLMGIDNAAALKTVTEFYQKSVRIDAKHNTDLKVIRELLKDMEYLTYVARDYTTLNDAFGSRTKFIADYLKELEDPSEVTNLMACDKDLLLLFEEFQDWMAGKTDSLKRIRFKMLEKVKANLDKLNTCFTSLKTYWKKKDDSKIVRAFNKLMPIQRLGDLVEDLHARKAAALIAVDKLPTLHKFYKDTVALSSNLNGGISELETLKDTFQLIFVKESHKKEDLTSGFKGTADVGRVFGDIESSWFKTKVAKTTNVTHFENSLQPFKLFAESIVKFGSKWTSTIAEIGASESVFESVGDHIRNISQFKRIVLTDAQVASFKNCWNVLKEVPDSDRTQLDKFHETFRAPFDLEDLLNVLVSSIGRRLKLGERGADIVQNFKDAFKSFDADYIGEKLTVDNIAQFQVRISSQNYTSDLWNSLVLLGIIREAQQKLEATAAKVSKTEDDFDISKVVTDSKTLEAIKCFNKDAKTDDLHSILKYLTRVKQMADSNKMNAVKTVLESLGTVRVLMKEVVTETAKAANMSSPSWNFTDSKFLVSSLSGGIEAIDGMNKILNSTHLFQKVTTFNRRALKGLQGQVSSHLASFWADPMMFYNTLLNASKVLNPVAKKLRETSSLSEMKQIFEMISNISGLPTTKEDLMRIAEILADSGFNKEREVIEQLSELDLNFVKHDLKAAAVSLVSLEDNFDGIFGHRALPKKEIQIMHDVDPVSYVNFILLCLFFILLLSCLALGICALTPSGRAKYVNTYLYYFGKEKDFEKRWRYSLFLDRQDGKNALIDAVREVNVTNVQKTLKRGAYVNVYNFHGNTCLHSATKLGYPEIVKLLIKNGADRTLLNHQNKVPEEMIPRNMHQKAKSAEYEVIKSIYSKYRKKVFRTNVPEVFPVSSFHIYIEERTDNNLTNAFMDRFQSITSEEPLPTTTHCIVKTSEDGVLETDQFSLLAWIFNGVIIVKDTWMADCLKDERLIRHDSSYLVEKVRYKGVLFENAVLPWSRAMAKGTMPFLYGVHVAVVMREYNNLMVLAALVAAQGGTMLNSFPQKENYNKGSHPYLHSNLGPLFIIHDGQIKLDAYKNDAMFTLFTEEQFLSFMLKRELTPMHAADPISVIASEKA